MKRHRRLLILAAAAAVGTGATLAVAAPNPGFTNARPAQLVATAAGVDITPILSTGDVLPGSQYQMTGILDGLGAVKSRGNLDVVMNHELDGVPAGPGTRISRLTLDRRSLGVLAGHYILNRGETKKYARFCSSTLEVINGTPWYFTGEESTKAGNLTDPAQIGRGGTSIAVNLDTEQVFETPQFGHLEHENVVPIEGVRRVMVLTSEDGTAGQANLYAYTARTFADAIAGNGQLWVWKASRSRPIWDTGACSCTTSGPARSARSPTSPHPPGSIPASGSRPASSTRRTCSATTYGSSTSRLTSASSAA